MHLIFGSIVLVISDKMSKKIPEWFEEYNKASERQRDYLNRVNDLRRSLRSRDMHPLMVTIERKRHLMGRLKEPKVPSMKKMEQKVICFGPKPFPVRNKLAATEKQNKFHMSPTFDNGPVQPMVRVKHEKSPVTVRPDVDLTSIATVADRNKLVNSGTKGRLPLVTATQISIPKSHERKVLATSRVHVKESFTTIWKKTPVEYITDISMRKNVVPEAGK